MRRKRGGDFNTLLMLPCSPSALLSPANANTERFGNTWASVAVKMFSAYLCYALYIWTMVAPLVLGRCRDFGYTDE